MGEVVGSWDDQVSGTHIKRTYVGFVVIGCVSAFGVEVPLEGVPVMLDVVSLGVAFCVAALTLLVLFYLVTFRRTRSAYSLWWCRAIALFFTGSVAYLFHDGNQAWANPLGNALVVAGLSSVWAAACTLRDGVPKVWQVLAWPAVALVATLVDDPGGKYWAGGSVQLVLVCVLSGIIAYELWKSEPEGTRAQRPLAVTAGLLSVFYFARWIAFSVGGPEGYVFSTLFNSAVTTLTSMVLLMVASFTMTTLSNEQVTRKLRHQATQDGLTGLLNRAGFLTLAAIELRSIARSNSYGSLILADLDHFKTVNDTYGHAAGDAALQTFASACTGSLRSTDLIGRYGGEEFIILLPRTTPERAETVTTKINRTLENLQADQAFVLPTVSYGIAPIKRGAQKLSTLIATADAALYEAKSRGRNQAVQAKTRHLPPIDSSDDD